MKWLNVFNIVIMHFCVCSCFIFINVFPSAAALFSERSFMMSEVMLGEHIMLNIPNMIKEKLLFTNSCINMNVCPANPRMRSAGGLGVRRGY